MYLKKIQISVLALHGKRSERFSTILVFVICCYNEDITMAMGLPLWLIMVKICLTWLKNITETGNNLAINSL